MRQTSIWISISMLFLAVSIAFSPVVAQDETGDKPEETVQKESDKKKTIKEEMVVTATRRATPVEKTPIAITVADQDQLETLNITDVGSLNQLIPSLQLRDTGVDGQGSVEINMRGIGNSTYVETGEPNVALSVDGVYTARAQAALQMIYDVERIEVARGPQGTLSGRNATVGSINIINKLPNLERFESKAEVEASNENGRVLRGVVNVPVDDSLAFRFNYVKTERDTPYNLVRDDEVLPLNGGIKPTYRDEFGSATDTSPGSAGSRDNEAFRLSALWQPTGNFKWHVSYEEYKDGAPGHPLTIDTNRILGDLYVTPGQRGELENDPWTAIVSDPARLDLEIQNLRSAIEVGLGDSAEMKYTYGHSEFSQMLLQDADGGVDIQIVFFDNDWTNSSNTHDLNFHSLGDGRFQWTAGLYYFEESNTRSFGVDFPPFGYVAFFQPDIYAESKAAYADVTYSVNDKMDVFGGIRYTEDERGNRGGGSYGPFTGNPACADGGILGSTDLSVIFSDRDGNPNTGLYGQDCRYDDVSNQKDFSYEDWRAGFNYFLNDDTMMYVSAATGHKSGLFDTQFTVQRTNTLVSIPLEPEENLSYEIGIKGTGHDGRFRYAADIFYMDFEGKQESSILSFGDRFCDLNGDGDADDPGETDIGCATSDEFIDLNDNVFADQNEFLVVNIEGLDVQGLEFEYSWTPTPNDVFTGYFTYVDAEFREYLAQSSVQCNTRFGAGNPCPIENWEGRTPKNTPEYTLNSTYSRIFGLPSGNTLTPTLNVYYRSEYHLTNENLEGVSAQSLGLSSAETDLFSDVQDASVKANFLLRYASPKYDVELFATNLFDEDVRSHERTDTGNIPTYVFEAPREYGIRFRAHF